MAKCKECGAGVLDESKFCNFCGAALAIIDADTGAAILSSTADIKGHVARIDSAVRIHGTAAVPLAEVVRGERAGLSLLYAWSRSEGFRVFLKDPYGTAAMTTSLFRDLFWEDALEFSPNAVVPCSACGRPYHLSRGGILSKGPDDYSWGVIWCPHCRHAAVPEFQRENTERLSTILEYARKLHDECVAQADRSFRDWCGGSDMPAGGPIGARARGLRDHRRRTEEKYAAWREGEEKAARRQAARIRVLERIATHEEEFGDNAALSADVVARDSLVPLHPCEAPSWHDALFMEVAGWADDVPYVGCDGRFFLHGDTRTLFEELRGMQGYPDCADYITYWASHLDSWRQPR